MTTSTRADDLADRAALWPTMQRMLARLADAADRESFLDDCLDAVVELVGADRGLLLLFHDDGAAQAINARRNGAALDPYERDEISKSIVRRVHETGSSILWRALEDASPTESLMALSIATALAVPLRPVAWRGKDPTVRAVLYVDFRDRRRAVGDAHREFAEAAAQLMAAVLEPMHRLEQAREDLRAIASRQDGSVRPTLEELLRPESMAGVRREIGSALFGDSPILVLGESGTGKTELAQAIAVASGRRPVVRATLGSSDDLNTITSELFGHERGSFSGALTKRTGLVELADGGTLIFDEILNLPLHAQQLLLDFTQFGTFRPLGHERAEPKRAKVRLVSVTNGDLPAAIRQGRFREDLYFRLASVTLELAPLRDRREEIPALADAILARRDPTRAFKLAVALRRLLASPGLPWRGNVRQLEALLTRARERALHDDPSERVLTTTHVEARDFGVPSLPTAGGAEIREPPSPGEGTPEAAPEPIGERFASLQAERERLDASEKRLVHAALAKHGGVVAYAARELGLGRTSLLSRMDTLGIERTRKRR